MTLTQITFQDLPKASEAAQGQDWLCKILPTAWCEEVPCNGLHRPQCMNESLEVLAGDTQCPPKPRGRKKKVVAEEMPSGNTPTEPKKRVTGKSKPAEKQDGSGATGVSEAVEPSKEEAKPKRPRKTKQESGQQAASEAVEPSNEEVKPKRPRKTKQESGQQAASEAVEPSNEEVKPKRPRKTKGLEPGKETPPLAEEAEPKASSGVGGQEAKSRTEKSGQEGGEQGAGSEAIPEAPSAPGGPRRGGPSAETKARRSRKSSAYHVAMLDAKKRGLSVDEQKAAAKADPRS